MFFAGGGDLFVHVLDGRHRTGDLLQRASRAAAQFNGVVGQGAAVVQRGCDLLSAGLQCGDQFLDLFCGLLRALRQAAYLIGDHREAAPGFTSASCFDGRIQGQQVGLLRNRLDYVENADDLVAFQLEFAHRLRRVHYLASQLLDLTDCPPDNLVTAAGLLIRLSRSLGSLLSITRDFLHRRGHFIHGRGHLVGLVFLTGDPDASLLGHR